jgi:hypothetical protein
VGHSKPGGEGNGATASEHREACKVRSKLHLQTLRAGRLRLCRAGLSALKP